MMACETYILFLLETFEHLLPIFIELVQKAFDGEMRDRPKGLTADLLPFQKEGVSWMYCQEVNVKEIRGGILADEMVRI